MGQQRFYQNFLTFHLDQFGTWLHCCTYITLMALLRFRKVYLAKCTCLRCIDLEKRQTIAFWILFCHWCTRVLSRFFDRVGHKTMYASSGNKNFPLNNVTVRLTKIMNNLLEHLKILIFKVIFQCGKLIESFQKNFFEEYWTKRPTFNIYFF